MPPVVSIQDLIQLLRENFIFLIGGLLFGIACGFIAQKTIPRAYESTAKFVVSELPYYDQQSSVSSETEQQLVETLIMSIPSRDMHDEVARRLGISPAQIAFSELDLPLKLIGAIPRANIRVDSADKSRMGEIVATSQSPEFAAKVANAILDELQLFNMVGGRLKNLRLSMDLTKAKLDSTVKQLVDLSSQRIKLEQETAELDNHIRLGLPLTEFPAFAQDGTLNNLKTQLILIDSEYASIAATATRGARLDGKRAERDGLKQQLQAHVERLAGSLRSEYEIAKTQERNVERDVKDSKDKLDMMSEQTARLSQSLSNPAAMRAIESDPQSTPVGPANIIVTIDRAAPKMKPIRPKLWLNLLLGVLFGSALGAGITALRFILDNRLKSTRQIEQRTGQPCLAMLPPLDPVEKKANIFDRPRSPIGLGYLRSHLLRTTMETGGRRIIGFTPSRQNGDASRMVATLAILLAQAEKRTLVIDLHRKPARAASILGVSDGDGLSRWLGSDLPLQDCVGYTTVRELGVLGFGKATRDLDDMLGRRPLSMELAALLPDWDFILINSPPIRFDWSMMLTLPSKSPIIITADYRNAKAGDVNNTVQRARNTRWLVDGVVLLNCPNRIAGSKSL